MYNVYTHHDARYFSLLLFNAYLSEQVFEGLKLKFSEWSKTKPEIATLALQIKKNTSQALKIASSANFDKEESSDNATMKKDEQVVVDRDGDVLVTGTILKSDHFPSMQRQGLSI